MTSRLCSPGGIAVCYSIINQGHMAWNPSGTHLAIGHSPGVLVNNWAATVVAKDGRKGDMQLRSDRHSK